MANVNDERLRIALDRAEAERLLAEARTAHRNAERERSRARKIAGRLSRRVERTLDSARAQLDADRMVLEARVARFNETQSTFNSTMAADRARLREAWTDLAARQKRSVEEWDEASRFQADQAAALDARAAALDARERGASEEKDRLQHDVTLLREEAATLESRVRNMRQVIEELEQQREQLRAEALVPVAVDEVAPVDTQVALDRATDRDLAQWATELAKKEERLNVERATVTTLFADLARDKAGIGDQRRLLSEQFAQLTAARAGWQAAERATVAEIEQLAQSLRQRESELDSRDQRISAADVRRREDAYDLWQFRLRLEAWQSKLVAFEMRWNTEREQLEADFARREEVLLARESGTGGNGSDALPPVIPFAIPVADDAGPVAASAELSALRNEVERMAGLLLEAELPEPPEPHEGDLPWAADQSEEAEVFPYTRRAA
ncbi:Chromosome partition protein Smc [Gemmata sp. SH-PL17]|uniref:hypothetical protein n=1 Tax=Gemmata sp. SH-PL17 TaxID=1630693 RepID=UPI00078B9ED6|nr:hypothetical protein [Gemmata sp. SH-PL17]AMV29583.1 Chromosome partition protein Smc [Gemmata sp. SH-PL17]